VQRPSCNARRDRHSSGPRIAARLGATYPPTRAEPHFHAVRSPVPPTSAYLVLLRVEIARFTRSPKRPTRLCCS